MTWAIGACNELGGHAALVSDIQVTIRGGRCFDLVRKAYPVGPDMIGAFAGSVDMGFRLMAHAQRFFRRDEPDDACIPNIAAREWAPHARRIFDESSDDERALGAEFLLVGIHPTEDVFIPGRGMPYLCKLSAPDFEPEIVRNGNSALSIGHGSNVPKYMEAIREAINNRGILQSENFNGWTQMLAFGLSAYITKELPVPGISRHFHIHDVSRGSYSYSPFNYKQQQEKGGPMIEFNMPKVAESFDELVKMLEGLGEDASAAAC